MEEPGTGEEAAFSQEYSFAFASLSYQKAPSPPQGSQGRIINESPSDSGDSRPQERWLETHPGDINPLSQFFLASPLKGLRINNRIVKMIYHNNFYKKIKQKKL